MGKLWVGAEAKVPIVLIIDCESDLFKLRLPVFWDGQDGYGVLGWIFIQTDGDMFIVPGVIFLAQAIAVLRLLPPLQKCLCGV